MPDCRRIAALGVPIPLTVWVDMGISVTDTWMVSRLGARAVAAIASLTLSVALILVAAPASCLLADGTPAGEAAAGIACTLILLLAATELIEPFATSASGLLRGLDDTFVPMLIHGGSYWLVALPLASWLVPRADAAAVALWCCLLLGMALSALLLVHRLHRSPAPRRRDADG